ncbi:hypothetical protein AMTR_s00016p00252580 [Amborella trichopoda]|uniref:Uncharacterized protein n=1 Tax=Amborella trichopoda TaxID=13333 RepID=W1PF96_AMBTC|nr:hypothetical protein AMTR_s00016p00252580 [Amborella trichopoda]
MDVFIPEDYVLRRQEMKKKITNQKPLLFIQTPKSQTMQTCDGLSVITDQNSAYCASSAAKSSEASSFDALFSCFTP